MERGRKLEELAEEDRKYVSDEYKREVVEHMSTSQVSVCTSGFGGRKWRPLLPTAIPTQCRRGEKQQGGTCSAVDGCGRC